VQITGRTVPLSDTCPLITKCDRAQKHAGEVEGGSWNQEKGTKFAGALKDVFGFGGMID
jgi:hypothetical protein